MPQDSESGIRGVANGYKNANEIATLIGAARRSKSANLFGLGEERVVIKTGSSAVVTLTTLANVDAVVYGFQQYGHWEVYRIAPAAFETVSVASRSKGHDDRYRSVRKTLIRDNGSRIYPPSATRPAQPPDDDTRRP
jgi:hypothetical protein